MTVRVRVYPHRFKTPRAIIHDGTRWRRVSEPWSLDSERSALAVRQLMKLRRMEPGKGWEKVPMPAYTHRLTAHGFANVNVDELEYVA